LLEFCLAYSFATFCACEGQKQRVALARSVYADPDITLLDDIFSALDSSTTSQVFDSLFGFGSEKDGILRSSGTILVTHAIQFLPRVDLILIMEGGCPTFCGTWSELQEIQGSKNIADTVRLLSRPEEEERKQHRYDRKKRREGISEHDGNIMTVEEREYGIASLSAWTTWFYHAGGWSFAFMQLVFLVFDRGFYVASDFWVAIWSDAAYESTEVFGVDFPPQTDGRSAQAQYVSVYALIIVLSVVSAVTRSLWAVAGGARCADQMFRAMTKRVLRAPMSYFETTPLGRVLNRFTYDVEVLDIELSVSMTGLMISFSWLVSSVVVMVRLCKLAIS
jgi:ABC-type multidrug transport system fused ATPase/permease subunit